MVGPEVSRFLSRYKGVYAVLSILILLSAFLESLGVGALFPLMSALLGLDAQQGGGTLLEFMQAAAQTLPFDDPMVSAACLLFGIVSLKAAVLLLRDAMIVSASATVVKRVKQEMFAALLLAPYAYFVDRPQENLNYRLTKAPEHLALLLFLIPSALAQALIIVAIVGLLATISWEVIVAIVIAGAALYGFLRQVARRVSHMAGRQRAAASAKELSAAQEFLSGIKEIVVAQAGHRWERLYSRFAEEIRRVGIKDGIWQAVPGVFIDWMFFAVVIGSMVALAGWKGTQAVAGVVPMMTVYLYAVYRLIRAVSLMSAYKLRIASQLADAELLSRTLAELKANVSATTVSGNKALRFTNAIIFANVSFRYPEREEPALRSVSLTIPRGRLSAFVGQSGAGKTTLVNLLLGLYRPTTGSITVDGVDLASCDRSHWLPLIGYVSQEAFILNGTIAENIAFGLTDRPLADIEAAAKAAYAHDFILELPQGYETEVGERGFMLSGGQRQRIAIARALLRKPEILIFDEATSQLDNVSEALIQKAIDDLSRTHTVIVIAHRLSMVKRADQIVVLDRGRVVECGRHEDLIARKGQYSLMLAGS